jgi:hypothetical protein
MLLHVLVERRGALAQRRPACGRYVYSWKLSKTFDPRFTDGHGLLRLDKLSTPACAILKSKD